MLVDCLVKYASDLLSSLHIVVLFEQPAFHTHMFLPISISIFFFVPVNTSDFHISVTNLLCSGNISLQPEPSPPYVSGGILAGKSITIVFLNSLLYCFYGFYYLHSYRRHSFSVLN